MTIRELDTRLSFMPEVDDACQYSTIYWDDKPVGTLQRRMVMAPKSEPIWKLYGTDGGLLRKFFLPTSYDGIKFRAYRELRNQGRING